MVRPRRKRASYEDLLALPEHLVGQIIDGELIVQPRPAIDHVFSVGKMFLDIGRSFGSGDGGPGGWWILIEPELHLGRDVLVPDIAGWRREVLPVLPRAAYFTVAPQWVCEGLSPGTA